MSAQPAFHDLELFLLDAEQKTERRVHRIRIVIHALAFLLTLTARLIVGRELDRMLYGNLFILPLIVFIDILVLRGLKRERYQGWIKYFVSVLDILYVPFTIFLIRTILGRDVFPLSVQIPAASLLFLVVILSGFRFNRKLTILNGIGASLVLGSLFVYDILTADKFDAVAVFSYVTILSILIATSFIAAFISRRAHNLVLDNYRHLEAEMHVTRVFGKYVAPEVVAMALNGDLELGGEEREVSILFCDVRNFTALSEKTDPGELVSLLNGFFGAISAPVRDQGGMVDKIIGDCLMAIFGAPLPCADYRERALRAALGMRESLAVFNGRMKEAGRPELAIGIGIASGPAVVGNVGTEDRMQYTAYGDVVNTASRIEGLCKERGETILVDDFTAAALAEGFGMRELDPARLKGKENLVGIFAL